MRQFKGNPLICGICKQPLHYVTGRGHLHPNGSLYVFRCIRCGYIPAGPILLKICPACHHSTVWVDDHCALPVRI